MSRLSRQSGFDVRRGDPICRFKQGNVGHERGKNQAGIIWMPHAQRGQTEGAPEHCGKFYPDVFVLLFKGWKVAMNQWCSIF